MAGRGAVVGRTLARALTRAPKYDSKWEQEYAEHLALHQRLGALREYRLKPFRLRLADGSFYTPDFMVVTNDDVIELHEVKGFWREAAKVRIKVAAELYGIFRFVAVRKKDGRWDTTEY